MSRTLAIQAYGPPSTYEVLELPKPVITEPTQVLIRVAAASVNPHDVKHASGMAKMFTPLEHFPHPLGCDFAGTVKEVGSAISNFRPGDDVYGVYQRGTGCIADWIVVDTAKPKDMAMALKSPKQSFTDAGSMPVCFHTALQALVKADKVIPGGLEGKTVFVPAGLSGTGSMVCQIAKNIFHAGKVITTVSTSKMSLVNELLGAGVVDHIVDYTQPDEIEKIGKQSVDFMFDGVRGSFWYLEVMKPNTGLVYSVSTAPSGKILAQVIPGAPKWAQVFMNFVDRVLTWRAWRWGVTYEYLFIDPQPEELEQGSKWVTEGKIRAVVGSTAELSNIDKIRAGCQQIFETKGGTGKFVVVVD
jgi:NADPH:quinone reductase-like Zn-dependent oxidoreductase